jgi:hypothetical protein
MESCQALPLEIERMCFGGNDPTFFKSVRQIGGYMAKKASSSLYKAARRSRDIEVLASGNPKKILRREKNKLLGRLLSKMRIWR